MISLICGESNEQNKQTNKVETDSKVQKTDRQQREGGARGLGEKGEGIKQKQTNKTLIDRDYSMVITKGKGGGGGSRGQRRI